MFAIRCRFAHSFNIIMRMRDTIIPRHAPEDPVRVLYSGSDDTIDLVSYIVCLHGRVPEIYELWRLNDCGVRDVHPFARDRLIDNSRENAFKNFFFDLQRCRILFIGRRLMKARFEFICLSLVTSDSEVVIYNSNIFVHEWGTNPTMIFLIVSNFT